MKFLLERIWRHAFDGKGRPLSSDMTRRGFLKVSALFALSIMAPREGLAAAAPKRVLAFHNLHTDETWEAPYWAKGRYLKGALAQINHIMRDHRTNQIKAIDIRLLDLLYALRKRLGTDEPFQIISGYRSPATNAALCRKGSGVARRSLHMKGKAVDICLPETPLPRLHQAAVSLRRGGVGYYPSSSFVHVDVGEVRYWQS